MSKTGIVCWVMLLVVSAARAQGLPVEVMAGHKRAGVDMMWFRNFSATANKKSPWLLFTRTRVSADYHNRTSFGVTTAVSYNFSSGFGIVTTVQYLPNGVVAKAGVQLYKSGKNKLLFSWLVAGQNTAKHFSGDWFVLSRWTPAAGKQNKFFFQGELVSQLDTRKTLNLTQRFRAGLGIKQWQFGLAADFNESGTRNLSVTQNHGVFLRREF